MTKAAPPVLPPSLCRFGARLVEANGLDFFEWILLPGMCFHADEQWWGDRGKRKRPHEGLDLLLYRNRDGRILSLGPETKIPAAAPGEVAALADDFLGRSLFVRHEVDDGEGRVLCTLYGHLRTAEGVEKGKSVTVDVILGTFSGETGREKGPPPHLHFSVAWVPRTLPSEEMVWETLSHRKDVIFIDPQAVLGGDDTVISPGEMEEVFDDV